MNWIENQTRHLSRLIKSEWHFADIGACVGEMTDFLSPKMKMGHLFEASPLNYEFLVKKYSHLVKNENLIINNCAVTKENGKGLFSSNLKNRYEGNLQTTLPHAHSSDYEGELFKVNTIKLDTYFKEKKIDFIKLDVEGAEWDVFEGAREIMSKNSIIFQVEFHLDEDWHRRSILKDLNYNIYTSAEWMGGNKDQKEFSRDFFKSTNSIFKKIPDDCPRPYQAILARKDDQTIKSLS